MIYFTSDLHFYHENIIQYANRPFASADSMNKTLIKNWNSKVSEKDEIYILGDVTMKKPELAMRCLSQLKGKKYLIRGNHDRFLSYADFDCSSFVWIKDYAEITIENIRFILFHYPIAEWNGYYKGAIHLHGHQHNHEDYNFKNLLQGIRRFDVGVDANSMFPVSVEDILDFFR